MALFSLLQTSVALAAASGAFEKHLQGGLERVLVHIEENARNQVGHYQAAVGPFPAWAPLAASTEASKAAMGFPSDAPLLAAGAMLASFGHEVSGMEGVAGAKDPKAVFHETGTSRMPPRPVWGPAAFNTRGDIEKILGHAAMGGIVGPGGSNAGAPIDPYRYQIRI